MAHYIGIKFRDQGSIYYFKSTPFVVQKGAQVIVKTNEGLGLGKVALLLDEPPKGLDPEAIKPIYRVASEEDMEAQRENLVLAKEAFDHCRELIKKHGLEMKLVDVEVYFDRSKMVFYFTAPGRIDFRELVKDLVRVYRTRIELRQIGVRHEAQMLGGIGNCGQVCCCRRFLRQFEPVTIKMAKEQQLFLNPSKISGACGRLLCCLSYEAKNYSDFRRQCPKIGKKFNTRMGRVKVLRTNLMRNSLLLLTEEGDEKEVPLEEWQELFSPQQESAPVQDKSSPPRKERQEDPPPKKNEQQPQKSAAVEAQPGEKAKEKGKSSGDGRQGKKVPRRRKRRGRPRGKRKKDAKPAHNKKKGSG